MRLTTMTTRELRMPFPRLAADARYQWCDLAICELAADDGGSGMGFAYALSGGAHAVTSLIERVLWPLVLNRAIVPHFLTELHVHLAAAIPSCSYVEFYPFLEAVLTEPLVAREGIVTAPDRAGHGLTLRPDAIAQYRLA